MISGRGGIAPEMAAYDLAHISRSAVKARSQGGFIIRQALRLGRLSSPLPCWRYCRRHSRWCGRFYGQHNHPEREHDGIGGHSGIRAGAKRRARADGKRLS